MPRSDTPGSLGRRLRGIRREKGVSGPAELAERMKGRYSVSGILKRERGEIKIDLSYIEHFCDALAITGKEREKLEGLGKIFLIQFDPWRSSKNVEELHLEYWERLRASDVYREYGPLAICGVMQAETYAYEMMRLHSVDHESALHSSKLRAQIGRSVLEERRKDAEKKLDRRLLLVTDEEALYRIIGSRRVMLHQLERLLDHSDSSGCSHRILPRGVALPVPTMYGFCAFDSLSATLETAVGAVHCTDEEGLQWLLRAFDFIYEAANHGAVARGIIERARKFHLDKL